MQIRLDDIDGAVDRSDGLPRFHAYTAWDWIEAHVAADDREDTYDSIVDEWLDELDRALGPSYAVLESTHVTLLSGLGRRESALLLASSNASVARLGNVLGNDEDRRLLVAFAEQKTYYDYIAYHYPDEGQFPRSAGVCLSDGCVTHVVLAPGPELMDLEATAAHELAHALLAETSAPEWVHEGVAQIAEEYFYGPMDQLDPEEWGELRSCWDEHGLESFKTGESFEEVDDRGRHSYELALLMVKALLLRNREAFGDFARSSDHRDGGDEALRAVYGIGLEELFESLLGELEHCCRQS